MAKKKYHSYTPETVKKFTDAIREDSYSITELCEKAGISRSTYYNWIDEVKEFKQAVDEAKKDFEATISVECKKSLKRLIKGYEAEETQTAYISDAQGNPKVREKIVKKKHVTPNLGAIIHWQTNKEPETWQNRQRTEVTGKDGKDLIPQLDLSKLSDKELLDYHRLLSKAKNSKE